MILKMTFYKNKNENDKIDGPYVVKMLHWRLHLSGIYPLLYKRCIYIYCQNTGSKKDPVKCF